MYEELPSSSSVLKSTPTCKSFFTGVTVPVVACLNWGKWKGSLAGDEKSLLVENVKFEFEPGDSLVAVSGLGAYVRMFKTL